MKEFIQHPKNYIGNHIAEIKQNIVLRKEKFNLMCEQMISELDTFQNECFDKIETTNLVEKNQELLGKIRESLDEWNENNKLALMISDDSKRKEIYLKAKDLDIMLMDRLKEVKMDMLMDKCWIYRENERVDYELQKELMKFEK